MTESAFFDELKNANARLSRLERLLDGEQGDIQGLSTLLDELVDKVAALERKPTLMSSAVSKPVPLATSPIPWTGWTPLPWAGWSPMHPSYGLY